MSKKTNKRGKVKTEILNLIYNSKKSLSRKNIVDHITKWSEKNHTEPITQESGIYKHIKELSDKELIKTEKKGYFQYYSRLEFGLISFKIICQYMIINNALNQFMKTDYFRETLAFSLNQIAKDSFNIKLPCISQDDLGMETLFEILEKSPTATKLLIFKPKSLNALKELIHIKYQSRAPKIKKDELESAMLRRLFSGNDKIEYSKTIKEAEQHVSAILQFVEFIKPSLLTCYYFDCINKLLITPDNSVNNYVAELIKNKQSVINLIGYDMEINSN